MAETIESGILDGAIKSLGRFVSKFFDDLTESGVESKDQKDVKAENGDVIGWTFTAVTRNGHESHIKVLQSSGQKHLYDVYCVGDNGKKQKYTHQTEEGVDTSIADFLEDAYGAWMDTYDKSSKESEEIDVSDDEFQDMAASRKIQIELSKINSSQEISFGPIFCNYDAIEVYQDLENVLDSDEFVDSLSEEPQYFEIVPSDDDYTITEISEIQHMDPVSDIIKQQYILLFRLADAFHFLCDYTQDGLDNTDPACMMQKISWQRDWLLQSKVAANVDIIEILKSIDFDSLRCEKSLADYIEDYCCCLDLYYPNFDHEVQSLLDEWLLSLRYNNCY